MIGWAYVVDEVELEDEVAPRHWRRWLAVGLAAVAIVVAAVWMLLPGASVPPRAAEDNPAGPARPLTSTWNVTDEGTGAAFTIRVPGRPATKPTGTHDADGDADFGHIRLGRPSAYLMIGRAAKDSGSSAKDSLLQMTARADQADAFRTHSDIRVTRVGTTTAYAEDFNPDNGGHVREFRFEHAGHVYSASIIWSGSDRSPLDTALAALVTLEWTK